MTQIVNSSPDASSLVPRTANGPTVQDGSDSQKPHAQDEDEFVRSAAGFEIGAALINPNLRNRAANGQAQQPGQATGLQGALDNIIGAMCQLSTNPFTNIGKLMFSMNLALFAKANVDAKIAQAVDSPHIKEPLLTFSAKIEGLIGHIKASLDGWKEAAISFIKHIFNELGKGQ